MMKKMMEMSISTVDDELHASTPPVLWPKKKK